MKLCEICVGNLDYVCIAKGVVINVVAISVRLGQEERMVCENGIFERGIKRRNKQSQIKTGG